MTLQEKDREAILEIYALTLQYESSSNREHLLDLLNEIQGQLELHHEMEELL